MARCLSVSVTTKLEVEGLLLELKVVEGKIWAPVKTCPLFPFGQQRADTTSAGQMLGIRRQLLWVGTLTNSTHNEIS